MLDFLLFLSPLGAVLHLPAIQNSGTCEAMNYLVTRCVAIAHHTVYNRSNSADNGHVIMIL